MLPPHACLRLLTVGMAEGNPDVQCCHLRLTLAPIPEPHWDEEVLVEDCSDDEEDE
jgi:hypothetical protein